ncbi:S8/S53 family peptidase [Viridibacillus sp. YIM B01967]|uniref:S8/S53 family peptidase n=1 Tax=Viridibacillus soli TaxID=2798301 RepID=A0ABS1H3X9_9BACL|nr:S8/S53 family peptidase [Viridibacillus soli]MBK3494120.1 S8/S53 family peptidase [Viridibacillus soli]
MRIILLYLFIFLTALFFLINIDETNTGNSLFNNQAYELMNIENVDTSLIMKENIKIGVVDVGITNNHPNIKSIPLNKTFSDSEDVKHGDIVSGIIAAHAGGNNNFTGILPGVTIYTYNLSSDDLSTQALTQALEVMNNEKLDVVNISLATPYDDVALYNMVQQMITQGTVVISSSGNYPKNTDYFLSSYNIPGLILVGALGKNNDLLNETTYNTSIDVWAIGENVFSLGSATGSVEAYSGTSLAAPIVTALVVLMKVKCTNKELSPVEIERMIVSSATPFMTKWQSKDVNARILDYKDTLLSCGGKS